MTPELLHIIERTTYECPARILAEGRSVTPVLLIFDQAGHLITTENMTEFMCDRERRVAIMLLVKFLMGTMPNLGAAVLVSESWKVEVPVPPGTDPAAAEAALDKVDPETDPRRQECVTVVIHEPTGPVGFFSHPIERSGDPEKPATLLRGEFQSAANLGGRMVNLGQPSTPQSLH